MSNHIKLGSHELSQIAKSPHTQSHQSLYRYRATETRADKQAAGQYVSRTTGRERQNSVTRNSTPLRIYASKQDSLMHRSASDYNQPKKGDQGNASSQHEGFGGSKFGMRIRQNISQYQPAQKSQTRSYQAYNGDSRMSIEGQDRMVEVTTQLKQLLNFKNWVSLQMGKFNDRLAKNENKVKNIDQQIKKEVKEKQKGGFSPAQTQQLNKILALVEKSGNRQEHKRNSKMIEELRQNILEVHEKISDLYSKKECFSLSALPKECDHEKQISDIKSRLDAAVKQVQESKSIEQKIRQMEKSLQPLQKSFLYRQNLIGKTVGTKKFQGQAKVLIHEQKVTVTAKLPPKPKHSPTKEPESSEIATIVYQTYHIDPEGYLLDENKFYLLDSKDQQIRLSAQELKTLQYHGLL